MTVNGTYKPTKTTQLAQQYDSRDNKLHLNNIPIPKPKPNEILVKVGCASLCHSDLMPFESNDQGLLLGSEPVTIGHEASGWVAEVGSQVKGFKEGDPIGFIPAYGCCYECENCVNVHNAWCEQGCLMHGFSINGYFQEYVAIDYRSAMILPKELDPRTAAPLFCAGLTAYHGVDDCELKPGQWMGIIGCGGLGHLGIQYAKAKDLKVIGIDISDVQLKTAKEVGADYTFNPAKDKDYVKKVMEITGGGVDAAVNFTASKKSYDDTPSIIKPGHGLLMVVGIPRQNIEFKGMDVALGRYRVKGSNNGTPVNMIPAIEFSTKHNIKPHLTLYKLEELPKMIEIMHQNKTAGRLGVQFA